MVRVIIISNIMVVIIVIVIVIVMIIVIVIVLTLMAATSGTLAESLNRNWASLSSSSSVAILALT